MNKLLITLAFMLGASSVEACVTYNPSNNTYTVDQYGCVGQGKEKKDNPKKAKSEKKK